MQRSSTGTAPPPPAPAPPPPGDRPEPAPPPPRDPAPPAGRSPNLLAVVVLSAVIGVVGGAAGAWAVYERLGPATERIVSTGGQPLGAGSGALTYGAIAERAAPSLVKVATRPLTASGLAQSDAGVAAGFVAGDGLVVTSAHAIAGATQLRLAFADGHSVAATVAGSDDAHGIAVLRPADSRGLTPLSFADFSANPPRPGDLVIAVSSPPFASLAVSTGTVSSTDTVLSVPGTPATTLEDVTTVDGVADPRDDGAPLLDGSGNVVGVIVARPGGGPPGLLALSGRAAADLVGRLSRGDTSAPLSFGIDYRIIDPGTAAVLGLPAGALVRSVSSGSPAAAAGILPDDVVVDVEGTPIDAAHPLVPSAFGLSSGQRVTLTIVRAGQRQGVSLIVG